MDVKKIVDDTVTVVLARVLEVLEEHPTQAKKILTEWYEELRAA